jgi:hypothetical protein
MSGLDLGRQIGPLPLGAWLGVGAGGLGIAYVINRRQPSSSLVPVAERGVGEGGGQFIYDPPQSGSPGGSDIEMTNEVWSRQALNWLISQGHDPTTADNALRKYLRSENLSVRENALINLVLLRFGAPPESPGPPTTGPETPPPSGEDDFTDTSRWRPHVELTGPSSVQRRGMVEFRGNIGYRPPQPDYGFQPMSAQSNYPGWRPPGTREPVLVTVWHSVLPGVPASTFFILAQTDGTFISRPGWTNPTRSPRRYTFSWRTASKTRSVRIIG